MNGVSFAGMTLQCDDKLKEILSSKPAEISVYSDGKHRTAIYNPVRVILNDKTEGSESEVLVITDKDVVRITVNELGKLCSSRTRIGELFDEFGKRIDKGE